MDMLVITYQLQLQIVGCIQVKAANKGLGVGHVDIHDNITALTIQAIKDRKHHRVTPTRVRKHDLRSKRRTNIV